MSSKRTSVPLIKEAKRQGHRIKEVSPIEAFTHDTRYASDPSCVGYERFAPRDACAIFYRSLNVGVLARKYPWYPGVYCALENMRCQTYYAHWGKYLLNQNYLMLPFNELHRRMPELFELLGEEDTLFVRPDNGFKSFSGGLVHKENWQESLKLMEFSIEASVGNAIKDQPKTDLTIVAPPWNLEQEWRFLVVNRKVVAGSQYKFRGQYKPKRIQRLPPDCDLSDIYPNGHESMIENGAFYFADQLAKESWQPDKAYTLDICRTREGQMLLLEIGGFSCAGMYHMEPEIIIREITKAAIEDWKELICP